MEEQFKAYSIAKHVIQLVDAKLYSLNVSFNGGSDEPTEIPVSMGQRIDKEDDTYFIYLMVSINGGQYDLQVVHQGECKVLDSDIAEHDIRSMLEDLILVFLLPYARECISSTLARMQLPIHMIPTIDILQTMLMNKQAAEVGE